MRCLAALPWCFWCTWLPSWGAPNVVTNLYTNTHLQHRCCMHILIFNQFYVRARSKCVQQHLELEHQQLLKVHILHVYIQAQSSIWIVFLLHYFSLKGRRFSSWWWVLIWSPKKLRISKRGFSWPGTRPRGPWGPCRIAGSYVDCMGCFFLGLTWFNLGGKCSKPYQPFTSWIILCMFSRCFCFMWSVWNIWIIHGIIFKWFMRWWGGRLWHRFLASKFQSPQVHSGHTRPFPQRTGVPFDRWRL